MDKVVMRLQAVQEQIEALNIELTICERDALDNRTKWGYPDLIDCGFLLREIGTKLDQMRKDANAHMDAISLAFSSRVLEDAAALANPSCLKGELASGEPRIEKIPDLPKKSEEPERYREIMNFLGIPEDKHNLARIDWKNAVEFCTQCAENGTTTPPSFGTVRPKLRATYRKRRQTQYDD